MMLRKRNCGVGTRRRHLRARGAARMQGAAAASAGTMDPSAADSDGIVQERTSMLSKVVGGCPLSSVNHNIRTFDVRVMLASQVH